MEHLCCAGYVFHVHVIMPVIKKMSKLVKSKYLIKDKTNTAMRRDACVHGQRSFNNLIMSFAIAASPSPSLRQNGSFEMWPFPFIASSSTPLILHCCAILHLILGPSNCIAIAPNTLNSIHFIWNIALHIVLEQYCCVISLQD